MKNEFLHLGIAQNCQATGCPGAPVFLPCGENLLGPDRVTRPGRIEKRQTLHDLNQPPGPVGSSRLDDNCRAVFRALSCCQFSIQSARSTADARSGPGPAATPRPRPSNFICSGIRAVFNLPGSCGCPSCWIHSLTPQTAPQDQLHWVATKGSAPDRRSSRCQVALALLPVPRSLSVPACLHRRSSNRTPVLPASHVVDKTGCGKH